MQSPVPGAGCCRVPSIGGRRLPALPLASSTSLAATEVDTSPERVDRAVEAVFSDPDLRDALRPRGGGLAELLTYIRYRVEEFVRELFEKLYELHENAPSLYWLLFVGLCLVLVVLLGHIGWTLFRALRVESERGEREEALAARVRRFEELRRESRELAAHGDLRQAARLLLLALLALVEERRALAFARSWTNREIVARLRLGGASSDELQGFAATIEHVWYGGASPSAERYARLEAALERLARAVRGTRRAESPEKQPREPTGTDA